MKKTFTKTRTHQEMTPYGAELCKTKNMSMPNRYDQRSLSEFITMVTSEQALESCGDRKQGAQLVPRRMS